MSQTYTTPNNPASGMDTVVDDLNDNTEALRSSFSGPTAPTDPPPVDGQTWYDDANDVWYLRQAGAWVRVTSLTHTAPTDYNLQQAQNFRLENQAGDEVPSPANVGQAYLETGAGLVKVVVSDTGLGTVVHAVEDVDAIAVQPENGWRGGSTPATEAQIGVTPVLLLDALGETAVAAFHVPAGYSGTKDLTLRLRFALESAETAGDDINVTVNVRSVEPDASEALDGTTTAVLVSHDIGAVIAQYTVHTVDVPLDHLDVTNPIAAGDLVSVSVELTNQATVSAVNLVGGHLLAPFGTKLTE